MKQQIWYFFHCWLLTTEGITCLKARCLLFLLDSARVSVTNNWLGLNENLEFLISSVAVKQDQHLEEEQFYSQPYTLCIYFVQINMECS